MEKQKIFTVAELKECIGEALDNWDFDACWNGPERKIALELAYEDPSSLCDDGVYEVGRGYRDIWDALSEYAESTAANIAALR